MEYVKLLTPILLILVMSSCQADTAVKSQKIKPQTAKHKTVTVEVVESECQYVKPAVLPELVLTGTDAIDKSFYSLLSVNTGTFITDMGGAELTITILEENGSYRLERLYQEPSMSIEEKNYTELCKNKTELLGRDLIVEFVEDGLLVWEGQSGVDFISNELWIFLKRSK